MEDIAAFLEKRKQEGTLRALRLCPPGCIDFSSNDYLGFRNNPSLIKASIKAVAQFGAGSSGSRLLSGNSELVHSLEKKVASFKGKEAALVFNSGYQANIGIISSLMRPGDVIFADKLVHASLIDGILLSSSRFFRFHHNDTKHLEALLKKERSKFKDALIVTESVFSMDGDRAPLKKLAGLKKKFNCLLMVDEAHATGIFGKNGSGLIEEEGVADCVDLAMGTFSKALGSFGAYVAASKTMIDYLVNTARSFIYSTALPPAVIAVNMASLDLVRDEPDRRKVLLKSAEFLRQELRKKNFDVRGSSQIIPVIIGDVTKTRNLALSLQKKGYWVLPLRPPTVPKGESRLRISLTVNHTQEMLKNFIHDISNIRV